MVKLADGRHEIVHIDKMCNECGNCTQFCPYASEPCHDKFTLFQTEKDMNESENKGVLFLGGDKIRVRLEKDEVLDLSQPNELPQDIESSDPHAPQQMRLSLHRNKPNHQAPSSNPGEGRIGT